MQLLPLLVCILRWNPPAFTCSSPNQSALPPLSLGRLSVGEEQRSRVSKIKKMSRAAGNKSSRPGLPHNNKVLLDSITAPETQETLSKFPLPGYLWLFLLPVSILCLSLSPSARSISLCFSLRSFQSRNGCFLFILCCSYVQTFGSFRKSICNFNT